MKRREVVILLLAAAGVLYAVWSLFLAPAPGSGPAMVSLDRAGLEKTATEVRDMVAKSHPSILESFVLARAASPLPRDPFHRTTSPGEAPLSGDKGQMTFIYNGFLEMDGVRFAIINGMEYRVGDELDAAGYFLVEIARNKVVLEHRLPGQASAARIVVPMSEAEMEFAKKESKGNGTSR